RPAPVADEHLATGGAPDLDAGRGDRPVRLRVGRDVVRPARLAHERPFAVGAIHVTPPATPSGPARAGGARADARPGRVRSGPRRRRARPGPAAAEQPADAEPEDDPQGPDRLGLVDLRRPRPPV